MKNDTKKGMLMEVLYLTHYKKPKHACPLAYWHIGLYLWLILHAVHSEPIGLTKLFSWISETWRCTGLLCHPAVASLLDIVRYTW